MDSTNCDPEFMDIIITGDESWVNGYDPETKSQSSMKIRREHETLPHSNAACHQLTLLTGGRKFTYAYESSRSPNASALH